MAFNPEKFISKPYKHRTAEIDVPRLAEFFDEGDDCKWTVRGLSSADLGRVNETIQAAKADSIRGMMAKAASDAKGSQAEAVIAAIQEFFSAHDRLPNETNRRITMLHLGSVDPQINRNVAVKLAEHFPVEFMTITNKINELIGEGSEVGE